MRKGVTLQKRFSAICAHCGKTFQTASDRARYCSPACKQSAYRLRQERRGVTVVES